MTVDLDTLLNAAAPELVEPAGTTEALAELVLDARRAAVLIAKRRRRRALLTGMASAAILTVGGTAAASVLGWSTPWGKHPLTSISYRLPSGGICEQRIGDLQIPNPSAQRDIQQWLGQQPITNMVDVTGAIQQLRAERNVWGSMRVGFGTTHYDADWEYDTALWQAVSAAIRTKLQVDGYPSDLAVTWGAETHCSGANPDPEVPSWAK